LNSFTDRWRRCGVHRPADCCSRRRRYRRCQFNSKWLD
jgi:hypothetical protein